MSDGFPFQMRVRRVGGILEAVYTKPLINDYVGLLEFDDGSVVELRIDTIAPASWPTGVTDIPIQAPAGDARIVGRTVTGAALRKPQENVGRAGRTQLFMILDGEMLFGLIPTKLGTVLHIEPALTSPLVNRKQQLVSLAGDAVSLDDLVLS